MQTRFNFAKVSPAAYKAVAALEQYVQESGLERRFIHLIKLRASPDQWLRLLCRYARQGIP